MTEISIEKRDGRFYLIKGEKSLEIKDYGMEKPANEIIMSVLYDKDRYDATYGLKAFCELSEYDITSIHEAVQDFEYCERISKGIDDMFSIIELNALYSNLSDETEETDIAV